MVVANHNGGQPPSLETLFDRIAEIEPDPEKRTPINIGALHVLRFNEPEKKLVGTLGSCAPEGGLPEVKIWDNALTMGDPSFSIGINPATRGPYLRPKKNLHFQIAGALHLQALLGFLEMTKKFAPKA